MVTDISIDKETRCEPAAGGDPLRRAVHAALAVYLLPVLLLVAVATVALGMILGLGKALAWAGMLLAPARRRAAAEGHGGAAYSPTPTRPGAGRDAGATLARAARDLPADSLGE